MSPSPRKPYGGGDGFEEPFFENDPLFGELRRTAPAPDLSGPVLERVERKGVFVSARLRWWIAVGRVTALALGLGLLGGALLAKRYAPTGALLPVRQQPATAALDQGCNKAAQTVERALLRRGDRQGGWALLRIERDGSTAAAQRPCSTTPTQALVAALWSASGAASSGVAAQRAGPGVIELWHAPASPAQAPALLRRMQLLSGQPDAVAAEQGLAEAPQPSSRR